MNFSKEFVNKFKREFPEETDLAAHLAEGTEDLLVLSKISSLLFGFSKVRMDAAQIIAAFDEGRSLAVKEHAEKAVRCAQLYREWDARTHYALFGSGGGC